MTYPVAMRVDAGDADLKLVPLMDDQELDSRASVGTIYWEGAVRALAGRVAPSARGYLELTGYGGALKICARLVLSAPLELAHPALELENVLRLPRYASRCRTRCR